MRRLDTHITMLCPIARQICISIARSEKPVRENDDWKRTGSFRVRNAQRQSLLTARILQVKFLRGNRQLLGRKRTLLRLCRFCVNAGQRGSVHNYHHPQLYKKSQLGSNKGSSLYGIKFPRRRRRSSERDHICGPATRKTMTRTRAEHLIWVRLVPLHSDIDSLA